MSQNQGAKEPNDQRRTFALGSSMHYSAVAWRWRGGAGRSLDGAAAAAAAKAAAQVDTLTPLASWASFDFDVTIQLRGKERRVRWVGGRGRLDGRRCRSIDARPKSRFTRRKRRPASPLKAVAKAECRGRGGAADRPSEESGVVASPHQAECLPASLPASLPACLSASLPERRK